MRAAGTELSRAHTHKSVRSKLIRTILNQKALILMSVPIMVYTFIFSYRPLKGLVMAFQNFRPGKKEQTWVGWKNFETLFTDEAFLRVLRNTICMSLINLALGFFFAILLAILINEIKNTAFKKVVQSVSYLPHFLSWIIVTGLVANFLSSDNGIINSMLIQIGLLKEPIHFLAKPDYFWWVVGGAHTWKEMGWNSIIYLAAITGISPELYEAAFMDGANRFQKIRYITLPGLSRHLLCC